MGFPGEKTMASTVYKLQWITYILNYFQINFLLPISLWCGNQLTLHITGNLVFYEGTNIDCHLAHDKFKEGFI